MRKKIISSIMFLLISIEIAPCGTESFKFSVRSILPSIVKVVGEVKTEVADSIGTMTEIVVNDEGKLFSIGTGFFVATDGVVATAYHVVSPITKVIIVQVSINDRIVEKEAKLLDFNEAADVAILKIEGHNYPSVTLQDPQAIDLGEEVGFIGFPLLSPYKMVNTGIISAKVNEPLFMKDQNRHFLIINAFINRGNSGGPLFVGSTGKVIGIINARKISDIENLKIVLPENYSPVISVGNVDPIKLSVDTYNKNLELIGNVAQLGIGYSASSEYIIEFINNLERQ